MKPTIPENDKKPGLSYAVSDDGLELPVIDITHPAFTCEMTEAEISTVIDNTMRGLRESTTMAPEFLQELPRRSILWRGTFESLGTFMSGMMTYLTRLGPANLGAGYANEIDRAFAATIMPLSFRFRLRDVVRQLAWALAPALTAAPGERLELLNIAGGTAIDSLNALLLLHKSDARLLVGRCIRIHLLEPDHAGPHFARRALEALCAPGGALAGLNVVLRHIPYDWSKPETLLPVLDALPDGAISAGSTEGGLFDYGSDEFISSNLQTLHDATPDDFVMVGSVIRDLGTLDARLHVTATMKARPAVRWLGLEAFEKLARGAGWRTVRTIDSTAHHVVALRKLEEGSGRGGSA